MKQEIRNKKIVLGQQTGYPLYLFIALSFDKLRMTIKRMPLLSLLRANAILKNTKQMFNTIFLKNNFAPLRLCVILTLFFSCSSPSKNESQSVTTLITDDLDREIEFNKSPTRIVSLAPSITEIIYFLESEHKLIARTQACDSPKEVEKIPIVSTYPLDIESIVKLNPDIVFSVDGIVNANQINKLEELGIKVFFLKYETLNAINKSILTLGKILDVEELASKRVDSLHLEMEKVIIKNKNPLQVLNITWNKPIFVYGKNTPFTGKIEAAGGENAMKEILNSPYPEITREYILNINPDVIVGNNFNKMDSTFFRLYPELKQIKAYQKKQIFDVDDNLMSRPSPRYIESIIELKGILKNCE